ncbi:hypothetical protein FISHEDRAFT_53279, partial [Fistulina hepatica ATCC 64428]
RQDDRSAPAKSGQYSPQRYDNGLGKDSAPVRYNSSPSSKTFGTYPSVQVAQTASPYDHLPTPTTVDNELSTALRGMVVEDDFTAHPAYPGTSSQATRMPPLSQPRGPYNGGYAPAEYGTYYSNSATRDPYVEYPYAYGASDHSIYASSGMANSSPAAVYPGLATPSLHPSTVPDMHRQQPNLFYDYNTGRPPASQYYYPTQAMMYAPTTTPMLTPQIATSTPATLGEKKRELQVS